VIDTDHRTEPLADAVSRLASVYRSLPQSKLLGQLPDGRPRAVAGHALAALLARAGQGVEERALGSAPVWRTVPFDGVFVVGDQIAVTGYDLVVGLRGVGAEELVWSPDGRRVPAGTVVDAMLRAVVGLKKGV
jgi:hypothetical protein